MKRIHIIKNIALAILVAVTATSCEDWLTLYPQDRVVEENFWEDKNDLEGVRYAAYSQLTGSLNQFIIWGDIRSDSYQLNNSFTYGSDADGKAAKERHDMYKKVVEAQLDSTMGIYDWSNVYTTINFCNKVLQHGPEVLARDPQFTTLEWQEIRAEVTALRALNYFYLIRAFKDIPYTTRVINNDMQVTDFPLSNGLAVLDTLIADVRSIAGQGRNRFEGTSGTIDTHGLMTNTSIYALLADMYLWRAALREGRSGSNIIASADAEDADTTAQAVGFTMEQVKADCDSVIYYGQLSLNALARQNTMSATSSYGRIVSRTKDYKAGIDNAELIENEDITSAYKNKTSPTVASYDAIFYVGNSIESMFEVQFSASDQRKNGIGNHFWSVNNNNGSHFSISPDAFLNAYTNDTQMGEDCRTWYSCNNRILSSTTPLTGSYNFKWANCTFYNNGGAIVAGIAASEYNNWIIYRKTDVMLMIAEALAVRNNAGDLNACKDIVDAVHKRSTVDEVAASGASDTRENAIKLVMAERQVELLGEGKRWFDLVRYAERIGGGKNPDPREPQYLDGAAGVEQVVTDYLTKSYSDLESALKNRIKNRYGLYCPIYYMELKASDGQMQQNPVWNREK